MPLYIFCGDFLLCAKLRRSDIDASAGSKDEIERIIERIREKWPNTQIILRGDSGFAREEIMKYCDENGIDYIFGLAKNNRLNQEIEQELAEAKRLYENEKKPQRVYKDFTYKTLDSWSRERRVIGKAEYLEKGSNPRQALRSPLGFVVTSLKKEDIDAKTLYEDEFCARGDMENRSADYNKRTEGIYILCQRISVSGYL